MFGVIAVPAFLRFLSETGDIHRAKQIAAFKGKRVYVLLRMNIIICAKTKDG